jgi:NADH:ubiquinone oxidoreductase subunit K
MTILFAGINLNFVYLSLKSLNLLGHFIVITVIVLEGCVIAITLAYIYAAYRQTKSLDLRKLKGV